MKTGIAAAIFAILFLCIVSTADAYIEGFDDGSAGWSTYCLDSNGYYWGERSVFSAAGGNPGGHIQGSLSSDVNNRLYSFDSSVLSFGDLAGQTITFDYRVIGEVMSAAGGTAVMHLYIGTDINNYYVSSDMYSWSVDSIVTWTTETIIMDEANFIAWPGQSGTKTFAEVAAAPAWIGLVFTGTTLSDCYTTLGAISAAGATISIDNFGVVPVATVPVPGALLLFCSGFAGLIGLKRARDKGSSKFKVQSFKKNIFLCGICKRFFFFFLRGTWNFEHRTVLYISRTFPRFQRGHQGPQSARRKA